MSSKKKSKSGQVEQQEQTVAEATGEMDVVAPEGSGTPSETKRQVVRRHYAVGEVEVSPFRECPDKRCVAIVIGQCPKNEALDLSRKGHKLIRVTCIKTILGSRNHQVTLDAAQFDCDTLNAPPKPAAVGSGEAAVRFIRAAADSYHFPVPTDLEPDEVPTVLEMPIDVA